MSHGAITACEEGLKKTLAAPSSYKRISADYTPGATLSYEKFVAYVKTKGCPMSEYSRHGCLIANDGVIKFGSTTNWSNPKDMSQVRPYSNKDRENYLNHLFAIYLKQPIEQQQTALVKIEYDASNVYNAPIRSFQLCYYGPLFGNAYTVQDMFELQPDDSF